MIRKIGKVAIIRLLVMAVAMVAVAIAMQVLPRVLAKQLPAAVSGKWLNPAAAIILALAMIGGYRLAVRWLEGRKAKELEFGPSLALTPLGVVVGLGLFCLVYAVLWAAGHAVFHGFVGTSGLITAVSAAVAAAVSEELVFRGVLFRVLEDSLGTLLAVILSAGVFGLLHGVNPGATVVSTAAIALEAGVLLAAAYTATRSLWFPIGLHFGWNFTEGGIFGAAVSGGKSHGLFDVRLTGADLWTGGAFGPEASLLAVGLCLLLALGLLWQTVRAGRWVPLRFRMILD